MITAILCLVIVGITLGLAALVLSEMRNRRTSKQLSTVTTAFRDLDEGVGLLANSVAETMERAFSTSAIAQVMAGMDEHQLRELADEVRVIRTRR